MRNFSISADGHKRIGYFCLSLLLFILSSVPAKSQTHGTIKGIIIDAETGEPLPAATIVVEGLPDGELSDIDGNFIFGKLPQGTYNISTTYVSYKPLTREGVIVRSNDTTRIEIALVPQDISLEEVKIVAKANRETENALLLEQRKSVAVTQTVGARELSRKGIGDAEAAVAKISGISKQDGVKNVFVRGLGDRYNGSLLNGLPVPSEDPEYKNIALDFFGTDIIKNIGVNKVFSGRNGGDVGGAIIDISSKELFDDYAFSIGISEGINTNASRTTFLRPSGSDYFGFTNSGRPSPGKFDFTNKLDPTILKTPINQSFGLSGGKRFELGERPMSFFVAATHSTKYSSTEEIVRNMNTAGMIYQDQTGRRYSEKTNQLLLANLNCDFGRAGVVAYNFMMLHANNQYIGEYSGKHTEKHQDGDADMGFLRRQQANDNLLLTNQILSKWTLANNVTLNADISFNTIKGLEPDRRENYLSKKSDGTYGLTGSNRQKRFFSELRENDLNGKVALGYKLKDAYNSGNSGISLGYSGRITDNNFDAQEYNFSAIPGAIPFDHLELDKLYNASNYEDGLFAMTEGEHNRYNVTKNIHSVFAEGTYQLAPAITGNIGFRVDYVDMLVSFDVPGWSDKGNGIKKPYSLPSLNFRYDLNTNNVLRLGASKTYTLPQSKEISPFQYVNIGFASEGNPHLRPSDNYNIDLKWDNYLSPSELLSATVFYKRIIDPIGRVDKGNSAGLLTYDNISKFANVAGVELELRKNIFSTKGNSGFNTKRLSFGLNASFIYTDLILNLTNTPERHSGLEGASPFIGNADLTYAYSTEKTSLTTAMVFNYFSDRIYTNGTLGFKDIIETGVPTLDFISTLKFARKINLKLKATNLLNPAFRLTRQSSLTEEKIVLNQYRKGMDLSLGVSFEL